MSHRKHHAKTLTKPTVRGKHPMPALLRIPCALVFLMVINFFFTWFVLWRTNMCDADAAWEFLQEKPILVGYNYLLLLSLLLVLAAVTWRPFFSAGLFFCALSIITFINIQKYQLRAEPLLPEEFQMADQAGNIVQFVDPAEITQLVFGVIFTLVGSVLAEYYIRKIVGRNPKTLAWWDKTALVPRFAFGMSALALLVCITNPIIRRKNTEWIEGVDFVAWNQNDNYDANGFVIAFLYNLGTTDIEPPSDYSDATIYRIADKYRALKAADTERLDWADQVDDVVVILAETFYEPALLSKYYAHSGGDVTPNLHQIFRDYPSGYMYSPEYGGGTANVEFEVQTGLSNYWAMTVPYVNVIPKLDSLISVAVSAKTDDSDFLATGLHSYDGAMYKRNLAYPTMGYDDFIDAAEMAHTERDGDSSVYNDRAIYQEIIDLLKASDQPQVIGAITMQNHAPYAQANYPRIDFPLYNHPEGDWYAVECSFQSLHNSDQYLGEFIEALDQLDERVAVLWFGDHAMGNLDPYIGSDDKSERDIAHLTPYFVYANFEIESPYTTKEVANMNAKQGFNFNNIDYVRSVDLPTTTPNCLLNTMFNTLNVNKPALYYLVDQVCQEAPILTHAFESGGNPIKATPALKEYELVNYDLLYGKQYWNGN